MQSIATTTDDLKDREINAGEIHGVHPKWGYGGGADPGTEGAREYRNIILDLGDVRLADRDAVRFLRGCEADAMKLENCPAYVREWMDRENN